MTINICGRHGDRRHIHTTLMKVNGLLGQLQSDLSDILLEDE